ncbi:GbsR/MarR family transcriptional regulator [Pseudonocardia humida]|uniref:MarR family transcriptional regulator n=1 Tax=Pseudonocardia humida TaxID=2800819 RepID=A0ABT1A9W6_9PSEU|nr:MarR family transcriptional regulator [Pseudonocardia humida]MCO1659803.1 MarR family transcriptional regulator [Pseudonocardia humida]
MDEDENAFVDRLGLFFETLGAPRTMGRLYGRLMICEPAHQSLTELSIALGVSKASVSTVIRMMQEGGMVERLPTATRRHHYRITPGGFARVVEVQLSRMRAGIDAAEYGLSLLRPDQTEQRDRIEEFRDLCEFSDKHVHEQFAQRWAEYRSGKDGRP